MGREIVLSRPLQLFFFVYAQDMFALVVEHPQLNFVRCPQDLYAMIHIIRPYFSVNEALNALSVRRAGSLCMCALQ